MCEKQVLMRCKYTYDGFLWKVLAVYENKFVVWDYNSQTDGFSSGSYHLMLGDALIKYIDVITQSRLLDIQHIQFRDDDEDCWHFRLRSNTPFSKCGEIENKEVSVEILKKIFGKPCIENKPDSGEKTDIEWDGVIEGYRFNIYNYCDGKARCGDNGIAIDDLRDWHIGGNAHAYVAYLVNEKIREADIC